MQKELVTILAAIVAAVQLVWLFAGFFVRNYFVSLNCRLEKLEEQSEDNTAYINYLKGMLNGHLK